LQFLDALWDGISEGETCNLQQIVGIDSSSRWCWDDCSSGAVWSVYTVLWARWQPKDNFGQRTV